jgi:hypothetical protein
LRFLLRSVDTGRPGGGNAILQGPDEKEANTIRTWDR